MKRTKIAACLISVLAAASVVTACGSDSVGEGADIQGDSTSDTAAASVDTAELTELEKRLLIPDHLPEKDWEGREFRILMSDLFNSQNEIWVEEQNGEQCNDAVYTRNEKIESRFNVKIALDLITNADDHSVTKQFNKLVLAGDDAFEIAGYCDYLAYEVIAASSCLDWTEIPMLGLDQPWHNKPANDGATVNEKLFAICSDISVTSLTFTYAMFFNQRLCSNYDIGKDTLYQYVWDGAWTIDKFIELTRDIYTDTNGDGKADEEDFYGFGCKLVNPGDIWLTAFDQSVMKYEDGEMRFSFMTEKTESALSKMHEYFHDMPGTVIYDEQYEEETAFAQGKLVFAPLRFYAAFNALREMEDDYSILPLPKWDEGQENYYTNADDKFHVFSAPKTVSDPEFLGMIYEALCAESYRRVYPAYYDTALKGKYSSDAETADMLDLIMAGRKFDFSFQFGEKLGNLPYLFRSLLDAKSPNIASKWASAEKSLNRYMEKFYAMYEDD